MSSAVSVAKLLLLGLATISLVKCSATSEEMSGSEEDYSESFHNQVTPSAKNARTKKHSFRYVLGSINAFESNSEEYQSDDNRRTVENKYFQPLDFYERQSKEFTGEQDAGIVALEDALRPKTKLAQLLGLKNQEGIIVKSFTTFFLAFILLFIYNGFFLHLF